MAGKKKSKPKGKKKEGGDWKGSCKGCPSDTVCNTIQECVLEEMDKYMPETAAGKPGMATGKQRYS